MTTETLLFQLLRTVICGWTPDADLLAACTPSRIEQAVTLAAKHDLAHLVGQALSKLELPPGDLLNKTKQLAFAAVYRHAQLDFAYRQICQTLEQAQIPFIPLKGSVLRNLYPEEWMRTSCDIDILVQQKDVQTAAQILEKDLSYQNKGKSGHDISLFSPQGIHLELHFTVMEDNRLPRTQAVLQRFWQDAKPVQEGRYQHQVSEEMFYFYHLVHMAKHMENGGCGIRPFLDLWILQHIAPHNRQAREALLQEGGLVKFAAAAENLAEVWFSGAPATRESDLFARFVLQGGVYGSTDNRTAFRQVRKGSRGKYLFSRIFMKYDALKHMYPVLEGKPWLTPVFQLVRWVQILFTGRLEYGVRELKKSNEMTPEEVHSTEDMLKYLDI